MLLQAILILFLLITLSIILLLLRPIDLKTYNLAVIGTVLDEDTQQPIQHAEVLLEDLNNQRKSKMRTHPDGGFWFTLQPTKKYRLLLVNEKQEIIDEAYLSTLSTESKIFDVILRCTQTNLTPLSIAS